MQKNLRIEYRDRDSGTTTIFTDWFSAEKHATILSAKGITPTYISGNIVIETSKNAKKDI